jgi:antitoxin (DNA-binding transcriptional repressor) of toxin-antitoxin stability system
LKNLIIGVSAMERISATKAARHFSELLNRVAYQGASFQLERGSKPVARLVPAQPPSTLTVGELNALFARLPGLGEDSEAFERDVKTLRDALPEPVDPWASS